jgi:hypothetical protein
MRHVPVEGADVTLNRAEQNTWAERHAGPEYVKLRRRGPSRSRRAGPAHLIESARAGSVKHNLS